MFYELQVIAKFLGQINFVDVLECWNRDYMSYSNCMSLIHVCKIDPNLNLKVTISLTLRSSTLISVAPYFFIDFVTIFAYFKTKLTHFGVLAEVMFEFLSGGEF